MMDESVEEQPGEREGTGEHPALVVPRSFSFEVLPEVAERVILRTKKYLENRAQQKKSEK